MTTEEFMKAWAEAAKKYDAKELSDGQIRGVLPVGVADDACCPITAVYYDRTGDPAPAIMALKYGKLLGLSEEGAEVIIAAADNDECGVRLDEADLIKDTRRKLLEAIQ